ncbi:tetracycline resistance protein, class C-like [Teleopsis dalmanni]|uniref:tetracycline resistance protein, class C-like n=1 Tax=Teleopsis dalmanni TaxID=139649 RepID=UPI0018CCB81E|nr:tetracycline resistance protein, class C-like [Teleopsis dalmanni]
MSQQNRDITYGFDVEAAETMQNFDAAIAANDENDITTPLEPKTELRKRSFILEPPTFLIFFAIYFASTVFQNQLLYQSCTYTFGHSAEDCKPLLGVIQETNTSKKIEDDVQPYVSNILLAKSLITALIPAILSLFVGPWSDKFGRRFVILATFSGYFINFAILTILAGVAINSAFSPWLYIIASVPVAITGSTCVMVTGIYAYISDVASETDRAKRFMLNEAALGAGTALGNLCGGYLYEVTNVVTIFGISAACSAAVLIYAYFVLVESIEPENISHESKIRSFFQLELVVDFVRTSIKPRRNYDRATMWITILSATIAAFVTQGSSNVSYLFLRKKFDWTASDFGTYNGISAVVQIGGAIIVTIILRRVFRISLVTVSIIALVSSTLQCLVSGVAAVSWEIYLAMALGFMGGVLTAMLRAILSLCSPANETAKIFALTTSLEAIAPLISSPIYTAVYNATFKTDPGVYNFIGVGVYIMCLIPYIAVYFKSKPTGVVGNLPKLK